MIGNKQNLSLVSVIINCYNGEEYLKQAIDSIYNQTYKNWEIIFWDNCSTDKSAEIAKNYGDKVLYYKSNINTTLGEARTEAIKKVNGEYITFLDCDDIWLENKLDLQVDFMTQNPEFILCYGSIQEITSQGDFFRDVLTIHESGFLLKELLLQYDISILTSMINRDLLIESKLNFDPQVSASEEYCLFMQLACLYKIGVLREKLALYRVFEDSLTSKSLNVLGLERRYTLDKISNNNPSLNIKHKKQFKEAYARSTYYDARWEIYNKNKLKAIKLMSSISLINYRYLILFLISILPIYFWNKAHILLRNRR
jgi:glycosyltransferase involved in cell wall biosynthesis